MQKRINYKNGMNPITTHTWFYLYVYTIIHFPRFLQNCGDILQSAVPCSRTWHSCSIPITTEVVSVL